MYTKLSQELTHIEVVLGSIASIIVCILCITLTRRFIKIWDSTDQRRFPRWTLIALAIFFISFSLKRLLIVFSFICHFERLILYWEVLHLPVVVFGMAGFIVQAEWVKERTSKLLQEYTDANMDLFEANTKVKELQAELILTKAKQTLSELSNNDTRPNASC